MAQIVHHDRIRAAFNEEAVPSHTWFLFVQFIIIWEAPVSMWVCVITTSVSTTVQAGMHAHTHAHTINTHSGIIIQLLIDDILLCLSLYIHIYLWKEVTAMLQITTFKINFRLNIFHVKQSYDQSAGQEAWTPSKDCGIDFCSWNYWVDWTAFF